MTFTQTADRIIEIAKTLGYGVAIDFTGRKPIKIKPPRGGTKSFHNPVQALDFLEQKKTNLSFLANQ